MAFLGIFNWTSVENPQLESSLAYMPEEMLENIFSFTDIKTRSTIKLTCRKWNRIASMDEAVHFAKVDETITQIRQIIGQNLDLFFNHNEHLDYINETDKKIHSKEVTSLCLWLDDSEELGAITQQYKPTKFDKWDPRVPYLKQSIVVLNDSLKQSPGDDVGVEQINKKNFQKINLLFNNLSFYGSKENILNKVEIHPLSNYSKALVIYFIKVIQGAFHTNPHKTFFGMLWKSQPDNNFADWFRIFTDPENYPNDLLLKNLEANNA